MPYNIEINDRHKTIKLFSYGVVTSDEMRDSIVDLKKIMNEQNLCCVMVDTTKQEEMPGMGSLVFITEEIPDEMKFAVELSDKQATTNDLKFLENSCTKKGKHLKCFYSKEEAESWIKQFIN